MKDNKLVYLSMQFAVDCLKLCESIKGHYSVVNQLERSSTSIGANITKQIMLTVKQILLQNCKFP